MTKGEEIVAAIKTRLETITGVSEVCDWRTLNLDDLSLPAIIIKDLGDSPTLSPSQRTYITLEKISVEIIVKGRDKQEKQDANEAVVTQLRTFTEAVESLLLHENDTLEGIIHRLIYTGSTNSAAPGGDLTVMVRTLTFDAEWFRNVFPPA
jgi:hypothetical protein